MCGRVSATTSMSIYNTAPLPSKTQFTAHQRSAWHQVWPTHQCSTGALWRKPLMFPGPWFAVWLSLYKVTCAVLRVFVEGSGQLVLVSFIRTERLKGESICRSDSDLFLIGEATLPPPSPPSPRCILYDKDVCWHNIDFICCTHCLTKNEDSQIKT